MKSLFLIQTERLNGQMEHSSWAAGLENGKKRSSVLVKNCFVINVHIVYLYLQICSYKTSFAFVKELLICYSRKVHNITPTLFSALTKDSSITGRILKWM